MASLIYRFISSAIVLALTAFFTAGFKIKGIVPLFIAVIFISIADHLVYKVFNLKASPFGSGIAGFVLTAFILYITKFFVPGFEITFLSALIAAFIYGILNAIIPGKAMFERRRDEHY